MKSFISTLIFTVLITASNVLVAQSNALDFDGSNDYVEVKNGSAGIASATPMTMCFWVYPTNSSPSYPNFDGFAGFRNESSADFYILHLSSTSVEARFRNSSGTNYDIVASGLVRNQWQHYALVYDGSTMYLYRNGTLLSSRSASGSINSGSETLYLGKLPFQTTNFSLNGGIDDFALWSEALNATEINCIYSYGIDTSASGLEIYYSFDQGRPAMSNTGLDTLIDHVAGSTGQLRNFRLSGSSSNWIKGVNTHTYLDGNICIGDSMLFNGKYYKEDGRYGYSIPLTNGCDSIIQLILTTHDADTNRRSFRICAGDSVPIGNTYYKNEGVYTETFSSQYGCDSTTILTLDVDTVDLRIKNSNVIYSLAQNASYQWYDCDGDSIIPGETGQQFGYTQHGTYAVIVTQNNCTDTTECLYTALGIEDHASLPFKLYPNPTSGHLNLDFSGLQYSGRIEIRSSEGALMRIVEFSADQNLTIDISDLSGGLYLFSCTYEDKQYHVRVLKP